MPRSLKLAISLFYLASSAPVVLAQSNKDKDKDQAPVKRRIMSWTADRREYAVGDVITVLVSEATLATATKSQTGSDQQTRQNDMGIHPPTIGTTTLPSLDADMSMSKNSASKQNGDAKRGVNFRGDISVRVIAVDKSGQLQIKGTKLVDLDKNKQTLNFTGWIRPEDVSISNLVPSERVADASLTYTLSGDIGKTRGGILGRLLTVFWP
jgi:flagellar L-ring protein precursor FlgH